MIFFNNDHVDIKDLEEAYNGCHIYGNKDFSYKNTASAKFANGRICEEKSKIDLYFWIDHHDNDKIFLRVTSKDGERIAHKYFSELIKESEQDD